jgi:hypothetical protein
MHSMCLHVPRVQRVSKWIQYTAVPYSVQSNLCIAVGSNGHVITSGVCGLHGMFACVPVLTQAPRRSC